MTGNLYWTEEDIWPKRMPKTAEDGFLLTSLRTSFALTPRWRPKRMAEWDEHAEWRYLHHSPLVEQLWERFLHLDVHGVEPVRRMKPLTEARIQPIQLPMACQSPNPVAAARAAIPFPRATSSAGPAPRQSPA